MKKSLKNVYPHLIAIILFIAISTIYFFPQLKGYTLKQHDIEQFVGMSKEIIDHRDKFGEEPLWTNATFGGMPAYQISTKNTNAINTIKGYIQKLIPGNIGHLFFMMIGFYILMLCFNVNPWLSSIGSMAFGLSSYVMLYLSNGHIAKVHAISLIPPILGGLIYAYRKNVYIGSILVSIFTCLHLTANHVQMTYYFLFLLVSIVAVEFLISLNQNKVPKFLKTSGILVIAGVLGVLPPIANLLVTQEYGKYTTRGKSELTITSENRPVNDKEALDIEYIKRYNMGTGELWSMVIPNAKGGKWES
ncbi:MAG: hypothetical protein HC906_05165 [Bacteroidales bacterium]|nr:hypothetical protein [Bacteroidales bacterium]